MSLRPSKWDRSHVRSVTVSSRNVEKGLFACTGTHCDASRVRGALRPRRRKIPTDSAHRHIRTTSRHTICRRSKRAIVICSANCDADHSPTTRNQQRSRARRNVAQCRGDKEHGPQPTAEKFRRLRPTVACYICCIRKKSLFQLAARCFVPRGANRATSRCPELSGNQSHAGLAVSYPHHEFLDNPLIERRGRMRFWVELRADGEPIGLCALDRLDHAIRTAS